MFNCSIALQILPFGEGEEDKIVLIDKVIQYLKTTGVTMIVSPFETVLEGEYDHLMKILKEAILIAGEANDYIICNVKVHYGKVLTIDEKLENYR